VSTEQLARELGKDPAELERKTGIKTRHWVGPETRAADVGADVLRRALERAGMPAQALRRLIYVTTVGYDAMIPSTGNGVARALGLSDSCDTFDIANACTGFLTGFDLAARSVATGMGPVAIVTVELNSRMIREAYPRSYVVMGDAAAAVVLGEGRQAEGGVLGVHLRNRVDEQTDAYMEHPLRTGRSEHLQFAISNRDIAEKAAGYMCTAAARALKEAGLKMADVEWLLPHQPNGNLFKRVAEQMGARPEQLVPVVEEIGSVAAASIPYSLDVLLRTRPVLAGHRILMMGVGAGLSYGAIVYQVGG
jgi:3-oxoacyl-(acyl-carrier-protein) synthase III